MTLVPTHAVPSRFLCFAALLLAILASPSPLLAEGGDPQALRPHLLAPRAIERGSAAPKLSQRHRATIYRSGLQRSQQRLEQQRIRSPLLSQPRIGVRNPARLQSRLNATRSELSRINRALTRNRR